MPTIRTCSFGLALLVASSGPDVAAVSRVVSALGIGRKVDLGTTDGRNSRSTIPAIDAQSSSVVGNAGAAATVVPYNTVTRLSSAGMNKTTKRLLIEVPIALAGLLVVAAISVGNALSN